jgi:hypothetical protein
MVRRGLTNSPPHQVLMLEQRDEMVMRTDDRQRFRKELDSLGYHHEYIDTWQSHVVMWWHKPQLNTEGNVVKPVGSQSPPQPGHPDTQLRLSSRGLLPWRPSEQCECSYCQARDWSKEPQQANEHFDIKTFPNLERFMLHERGRGLVLPALHGVEKVKGQPLSSYELMQKTREGQVAASDRSVPVVDKAETLAEIKSVVAQVVKDKYICTDCEFEARGARPTARASSLRAHRNKEHPKPVFA